MQLLYFLQAGLGDGSLAHVLRAGGAALVEEHGVASLAVVQARVGRGRAVWRVDCVLFVRASAGLVEAFVLAACAVRSVSEIGVRWHADRCNVLLLAGR